MRELTELRPKPMVEVGGRPLLWHIMKLYSHHGINNFVLCLGYKGALIKEYFLNYEAMNSNFTVELGRGGGTELHGNPHDETGWRVTLVETGENTMTGGRIKRAASFLEPGETFAVTYGDGVSNVNLQEALAFHRSQGRLATLTGVVPRSRFGELITLDGLVTSFSEKPKIGNGLVNGGFFFFEPGFLEYLSDEDDCVLERAPLEKCAADSQLAVYSHRGYWQSMDTFRDWESLQRQWEDGAAPWKVWK